MFAADWSLLRVKYVWKPLHGDPAALPATERNLARAIFGTGPAHAVLHPTSSVNGPDTFEAAIVADLEDSASRYPADAQLRTLISDLIAISPTFVRIWAASTPAVHTNDRKTIQHPVVGDLMLDCDVLTVPGADLRLVTYAAGADSDDAGKLDLLRVTSGQSPSPTA